MVQSQPGQDPILKKPFTKIRLVEWLKVKALSSSPVPERERERETDILTVNTFISFVRKRRRYGRQKLCVHHVCLRLGIWLLVILIS
jgi:hypothetical protein